MRRNLVGLLSLAVLSLCFTQARATPFGWEGYFSTQCGFFALPSDVIPLPKFRCVYNAEPPPSPFPPTYPVVDKVFAYITSTKFRVVTASGRQGTDIVKRVVTWGGDAIPDPDEWLVNGMGTRFSHHMNCIPYTGEWDNIGLSIALGYELDGSPFRVSPLAMQDSSFFVLTAEPECDMDFEVDYPPPPPSIISQHEDFNDFGTIFGQVVILMGGSKDPHLGPTYGDLDVWTACLGDCSQQQRESMVIDGIGGKIRLWFENNDVNAGLTDPSGFVDGMTYGAIIKRDTGTKFVFDLVTFTATPVGLEDDGSFIWGAGNFAHSQLHEYNYSTGGGPGGGPSGEPCLFPSPLNNFCGEGGSGPF